MKSIATLFRIIFVRFFFTGLLFFVCQGFSSHESFENSIVKIITKSYLSCPFQPWNTYSTSKGCGTGFVVEGRKIITNAHVVEDAKHIEVYCPTKRLRYEAKVIAIDEDCDLALLKVVDEGFFQDKSPLPLSQNLPYNQQVVTTFGYPAGGNELSITCGVVSRTEVAEYAFSGKKLILTQIDAAINPGNSGGPVFSNGEVVGISMQGYRELQNVGFIIPMCVVKHFLSADFENYGGFAYPEFTFQNIDNTDLRSYFCLADNEFGVLVNKVKQKSIFASSLRKNDIILDGGKLTINWLDSENIIMSGEVNLVFKGNFYCD